MERSVYTMVSKKIGFPVLNFDVPLQYPTPERAAELVDQAQAGDVSAFETIFRFIRFAESPINQDQALTMDIMNRGFLSVRGIYESALA